MLEQRIKAGPLKAFLEHCFSVINQAMKIKELKPGQGNVDLTAEIVGIEPPRTINKMGKELRVASATLKDDSGTITLTLWNEAIDQVQEGQTVHLTNAYVNTFQDKLQVTLGKFGKLEVV